MKPLLATAGVLSALGIAGLLFVRQHPPRATPLAESGTSSSTLHPALPSKSPARAESDSDRPNFEEFPPELRKIAIDLETAALRWERQQQSRENCHTRWNAWDAFSLQQISALETKHVRALAEWMTGAGQQYSTPLNDYAQGTYIVWASREPAATRAHLLSLAEHAGLTGKEADTWRNAWHEELSDLFHHLRVGHAMNDPHAAWEEFLRDEADPSMKRLVNASVSLPEIFREYAARAPLEAWAIALQQPDNGLARWIIEGCADGFPTGQDWQKIAHELSASLATRGIEPDNNLFEPLAQRWCLDNPVAALDWYVGVADIKDIGYRPDGSGTDPFADPDETPAPAIDPAQAAVLLRYDLLAGMWNSHKDRGREVVAILDDLLAAGQTDLVATTVGGLLGTWIDPWGTPLLDLIPKIPSPETRNRLLLQAAQAVPHRGNDPLSPSSLPLAEPNHALDAVRELAARPGWPPEVRAQVEAALHAVEEKEARLRAQARKHPPDPTDPFAEPSR